VFEDDDDGREPGTADLVEPRPEEDLPEQHVRDGVEADLGNRRGDVGRPRLGGVQQVGDLVHPAPFPPGTDPFTISTSSVSNKAQEQPSTDHSN